MTEIKKEELFKEIEELKQAVDFPGFFLANYFSDLRNETNKKIETKQINLKKEDKKYKKLNEIRKEMVQKIDSFEKQFNSISKFQLEANKQKINEIEAILRDQDTYNLNELKEAINDEQINLWQNLFLNKSIFLVGVKDLMPKSKRELIDFRLVILNDEFISPKMTKEK
jgi:hypothetical protein